MTRRPGPWGLAFLVPFFGLFYAVGLAVLGYGLWSAHRSAAVARWPTVPGTVTACKLVTSSDSDGGTSWQVDVRYDYAVAGRHYSADRLAFGYAGSGERTAHQQVCDRLRAARSVLVRYDPADPATAALSFGFHRSIRVLIAFGLVWLAFITGLTCLVAIGRSRRDPLLDHLEVGRPVARDDGGAG